MTAPMAASPLPRLIGINHVALEVGDIDEALAFYGKIFRFTLRGRGPGRAFIDMGDQFLALSETKDPHQDRHRHFGLVVDDRARFGSTAAGSRSPKCSISGLARTTATASSGETTGPSTSCALSNTARPGN